jgi:choline dehydrogenase
LILKGQTVSGLRYRDGLGQMVDVEADLVVMAAGVYGTPAILQRSGIGPADTLKALGIPPAVDLPVGHHLLDHPGCAVLFNAPDLSGATGRLFATNVRGPAGANGEMAWQVHPFPTGHETGNAGLWIYLPRQDAEGTVLITSADPTVNPAIDHRYNTCESDYHRFAQAYEFCQALLSTRTFARHGARSLITGPFREILNRGINSANHQVGTCKMGPASNPASVVGSNLRVHGFSNLMIADASIFPDNIMHNTNFTCMVIGEVAADIIRGKRLGSGS